ncbi:MAG: nucleotidyl transferase AbiEii/AbiGii toxin family protein, partial [Flavobacteriales bacterium]|nr:nucleotidyl transferase AbiEii/AbiGii toxin family protein [Flavobacteriales bacterium]
MARPQLDEIKRLVVRALVADELLVGILVLKGGNAIDLAYELSNRGSLDIDFSIASDFTAEELNRIRNQSDHLLNQEFEKVGLKAFDVKFEERPHTVKDEVKDFWGGYLLEFKLSTMENYTQFDSLDDIRRNALVVGKNNSTKFTVDISKYEYVGKKRPRDIEGATVYVYSPEMLALEKLRALCQQLPAYKEIVLSMTSKPRARDFYDIHNLLTSFDLDFSSSENRHLAHSIFEAKRVPLSFIGHIES